MVGFKLTRDVSPADDEGHAPDTKDGNWQESWCVQWYDPIRRAGGMSHVGLQRNRELADYWTALVLDGKVADEEESSRARLPAGKMSDLVVGPLHFQTLEPLRKYHIVTTYRDVKADLIYKAYAPVVRYDIDQMGAAIGAGHFESLGRVSGTFAFKDRTIQVDGFGFHDHSWGVRDHSTFIAQRNYTVGFGPDLNLNYAEMWTSTGGRFVGGYVQDGDQLHAINAATPLLTLANDGCSPVSTDTELWTETGRGYRLKGVVDGGVQMNTHHDDYFVTNGFAKFEMCGRLGAGIICVRQTGTAAQWEKMRKWKSTRI